MRFFLRLFPTFRALEADHRALAEGRISLEDRVRSLEAQNASLVGQLREAQAAERTAHKCVTNWLSEQMTGKWIYPDVPHLPEEPIQQESVPKRRMQARELQAQYTRQALDKLIRDGEEQLGVSEVE